MQYAGNAVCQRGQLTVAHTDCPAGTILLGKRRIRELLRKNMKYILKSVLRRSQILQLPLPEYHNVSSVFS